MRHHYCPRCGRMTGWCVCPENEAMTEKCECEREHDCGKCRGCAGIGDVLCEENGEWVTHQCPHCDGTGVCPECGGARGESKEDDE